jgi:integrase
MKLTYSVTVHKVESRKNKQGKVVSHRVRWLVETLPLWHETFKTFAQADAFRSELIAATKKGEPFNVATGRPVSDSRNVASPAWFAFAQDYATSKWAYASPNHRRGIADTMADVTEILISNSPGSLSTADLRAAVRWAVSEKIRNPAAPVPARLAPAVSWLERNTVPMSAFEESGPGSALARQLLDRLSRKQDGSRAAASMAARKRAIANNLMSYAIETGVLVANPLKAVKWTKPKVTEEIDVRVVANPDQAARLLAAVATHGDLGERLVAFFGCMYYAALRPEEVIGLQRTDLASLPETGWGQMLLHTAETSPGKSWTDNGTQTERRGLKHRGDGAVRPVPIHPDLVTLLRSHLDRFPTTTGDVFRGPRGGRISDSGYLPHFHKARLEAFTPAEAASPLADRPYALRHAAVSTWLNATGDPTQVAEWAGHSVAVLLRVYAKCISGKDTEAKKRILDAMKPELASSPEAAPDAGEPEDEATGRGQK